MKQTHLIALASLFVLFAQFGCDRDTEAAATDRDEVGQTEALSITPPMDDPISEPATAPPIPAPPVASPRTADTPDDPAAPSAFIIIQNAAANDTQLLIRQLQQVLPKTQVVKQVQSPNPREIKLEVTNIKDIRALANKIPFASVESIDLPTRTITVDFDL